MSYGYKNISNNSVRRAFITHEYIWWDDVFSSEELDKICEISAEVDLREGTTLGNSLSDYRISDNNFHHRTEKNSWIFERLNGLIEHVNNEFYNYDLNGYEFYQYSEYDASKNGQYKYHYDMASNGSNINTKDGTLETRKLSLALLLNEPGVDFKGGEFAFKTGEDDLYTVPKRGRAFLFPSYVLHKVFPVTEGIRKSLVVWVTGPKFK